MPTGAFEVERADGATVLAVRGEHDLATAPELERVLGEAIDDGRPVVIDLSRATFVDSSVLRAFISARERARGAGLGFAVQLPQEGSVSVRRVLEVTGLGPLLGLCAERSTALEAAQAGPGGPAAG